MSHVTTEVLASPIRTNLHQQRLLDLLNIPRSTNQGPLVPALPQLDGCDDRVLSANTVEISSTPTPHTRTMVLPTFDPYKYGHPSRRVSESTNWAHGVPYTEPTPASPSFHSTPVSSAMDNLKENSALALAVSSKSSEALLDTFDPKPIPSADQKLNHLSSTPSTSVKPEGQKVRTTHMINPALPLNLVKPVSRPKTRSMRKRDSPSTVPTKVEPKQTPEELLRELQAIEVAKIGIRLRTGGDRHVTTSLSDLQLARTPSHMPNTNMRVVEETVIADVVQPCVLSNDPAIPSNVAELTTNEDRAPLSSYRGPQSQRQSEVPQLAPRVPATETFSPQPVVSASSKVTPKTQRGRWCTNAEVKAVDTKVEIDSNCWQSAAPDDTSTRSGDSIRAVHQGKLFRGTPAAPDNNLAGWDGNFQPPPVDWNDRPRFNNNTPEFKDGFHHWALSAAELVLPNATKPNLQIIPAEEVLNMNLHPDGIGMVSRDFVLNVNNVSKYGYLADIIDVLRDCNPYHPFDDEDWGKIDLTQSENTKVDLSTETTEKLVQNWLRQIEQRTTKVPKLNTLRREARFKVNYTPAPNPHRPKANIYLRPVCRPDIGQLQELYNAYVQSGSARPCETKPISYQDMRNRIDQSVSDRLPFIVACSKDNKNFFYDTRLGKRVEKIVGFACASDFTAPDYVEHISAEIEVYVHDKFLRQGVGRCLLDKMMEATDPGHMVRGGYQWTCDPSMLHCYNSGGARTLSNVIFVLRHYTKPEKNNRDQNDYNAYLKKWLVDGWEFEEQGCLRGVGAKGGKRLSIAYLVKETKWLPLEGNLPAPRPF